MKISSLYQSLYIVTAINMRKKIVLSILVILFILTLITYPTIACLIGLLLIIGLSLNKQAKSSMWWKSKFLDSTRFMPQPIFRADYRRNFDMISLGSIEAYYDFNYTSVYGLNLSSGLQSFGVDKKIIRFYHSYLKKGGYVAISISPYYNIFKEDYKYYGRLFININKEDSSKYGDYYHQCVQALDHSDYPNMNMIRLYHRFPILFDFIDYIRFYLFNKTVYDIQREKKTLLRKCLSSTDCTIINEMIEFCLERGYRPFIVVLPIKKQNNSASIKTFCETINNEFGNKLPILNYAMSSDWSKESYYVNNNCLCKEVSEKFTDTVFRDITAKYDDKESNDK